MSKIVIESSQTLTNADLKIIEGIKKSGVVASGQSIMESSAVTFTNLPSGVEKKTAARIVANRMVEEQLASGVSLSDISWQAPSPTPSQPNDEIWYTTTDGEAVNVYTNNNPTINLFGFTGYTGPSISGHTAPKDNNGKGIIKFSDDLTYIGIIDNAMTVIGPTFGNFYDGKTAPSSSNLKTITFPSSMTTIGMWSLAECNNIDNYSYKKH